MSSLSHHGQTAALGDPATTSHSLIHPAATCKLTGSNYLVFGTLATRSTDVTNGVDAWTDANLSLVVWDCLNGVYSRPKPFVASAFTWKSAIDRATSKSITDYLSKLGSPSRAS